MKMIKRLLTPLLLIPTVASAHPGHVNEGFFSSSQHVLNGTEPQLIFLGLALFAIAVVWLVTRR